MGGYRIQDTGYGIFVPIIVDEDLDKDGNRRGSRKKTMKVSNGNQDVPPESFRNFCLGRVPGSPEGFGRHES